MASSRGGRTIISATWMNSEFGLQVHSAMSFCSVFFFLVFENFSIGHNQLLRWISKDVDLEEIERLQLFTD